MILPTSKLETTILSINQPRKKMAHVHEMLAHAKRPLIMTGGGVILGKASAELTQFARKYQIR